MSQALFFDTLAYAKELESGGFSKELAETQARALNKMLKSSQWPTENEATSQSDINQRFESLEKHMDERLADQAKLMDIRFADQAKLMDVRLAEHEKSNNQQFSSIEKVLQKIDSRLDRIDSRLDRIDSRLDGIDSRLSKVESDLRDVTARVDKIELRLLLKIGGIVVTCTLGLSAFFRYILP